MKKTDRKLRHGIKKESKKECMQESVNQPMKKD